MHDTSSTKKWFGSKQAHCKQLREKNTGKCHSASGHDKVPVQLTLTGLAMSVHYTDSVISERSHGRLSTATREHSKEQFLRFSAGRWFKNWTMKRLM